MASYDLASSNQGSGISSLNWSHTTASSAKMIAFATWAFDALANISGCSYNSSALAALGAKQTGGGSAAIRGWYHDSPASGSNTFALSFTGSLDHVASCVITATSSGTPTGYITGSGSTTAISTGSTGAGSSDYVVGLCQATGSITMDAATSRVEIFNVHPYNYSSGVRQPGSTGTTLTWTEGTPDSWVAAGARFPDSGGGGGTKALIWQLPIGRLMGL